MAKPSTDRASGQHGGNLSWLNAHYPRAPQPFIDLSTGINPYAYPLPAIQPQWLHRLPDAAETQAAQLAAARHAGADVAHIALASGMQPLMFALACLRMNTHGPSQIALFSPTYGEHVRIWQETGHSILVIDHIADAPADAVAVICNPNNPDARITAPEALLELADRLAPRGGWLIVDESFADLSPQLSIAQAKKPNLAVMRSCGKFFAAAGLRASFAISPPDWTRWLRLACGPWPLSTAACHMLPLMLNDAKWIGQMRTRLTEESALWRGMLEEHFTLLGHTPLFTLVHSSQAELWHDHLAAQGILARRFPYQPHWLRFGLPHSAQLARIRLALLQGVKPLTGRVAGL